jgi:dephospho-CoA kinase
MLKVGVTGNIGSGKTMVCRIFEMLGIPVYYADTEARKLMETDPELKQAIREAFGPRSYIDDRLHRTWLADKVFSNPAQLALLNELVHPKVQASVQTWFQAQAAFPYAIEEAALLVESGGHAFLDKLILVKAPIAIRLQRVMARDHVSARQVRLRMDRQMPEEDKLALADFIIHNDNSNMLLPQVCEIHQKLLSNPA